MQAFCRMDSSDPDIYVLLLDQWLPLPVTKTHPATEPAPFHQLPRQNNFNKVVC